VKSGYLLIPYDKEQTKRSVSLSCKICFAQVVHKLTQKQIAGESANLGCREAPVVEVESLNWPAREFGREEGG